MRQYQRETTDTLRDCTNRDSLSLVTELEGKEGKEIKDVQRFLASVIRRNSDIEVQKKEDGRRISS